jgi:hypothetical protein
MTGGKVSGNTSGRADYANDGNGGGVFIGGNTIIVGGNIIEQSATFILTNGEISGNIAIMSGGGVFVSAYGDFIMSGGEISGNTARGDHGSGYDSTGGGGVFVAIDGMFRKEPVPPGSASGIVYGFSEGDPKSNKTIDYESNYINYGHAVFVNYGPAEYWWRTLTAGENDSLDSTKTKDEGGGWDD